MDSADKLILRNPPVLPGLAAPIDPGRPGGQAGHAVPAGQGDMFAEAVPCDLDRANSGVAAGVANLGARQGRPRNAAVAVAAGQPLRVQTFAEWRAAARELLAFDVAPASVQWVAYGGGDLLSDLEVCQPQCADVLSGDALMSAAPCSAPPCSSPPIADPPLRDWPSHNPPLHDRAPCTSPLPAIELLPARPTLQLPRSLMDMLQSAACCRMADRWSFLYRVVWRWQHGERRVLWAADADGARLQAMVKAVHRDERAMHASIRFRERPEAEGAPRFVAWCAPAHDVLAQVAQHFVSRMGRISWMIATPDASVLWDGETLHNTGPLMRSAAQLDTAGEAPWLAYYRSIFDPARPPARPSSHGAQLAQGARHSTSQWHADGALHCASPTPTPAPAGAAGRRRGASIPIAPIAPDRSLAQATPPAPLHQCRRCDLWQHATQAVGGAGPARARIMLVGEQPGDLEDLAGAPFVGAAGQLLDRALGEAGLDRHAVYLTNAVKHFKWTLRGKRRLHKTPAQRDVDACSYWLDQEFAQVRPDVVVALGSTALKAVLGSGGVALKDGLGKPIRHGGRWVVAVYHPSYVLRIPDDKAKAQARAVIVDGLKLAQRLLAGGGGG